MEIVEIAEDVRRIADILERRFPEFQKALEVQDRGPRGVTLEMLEKDVARLISLLRGRFGEFNTAFNVCPAAFRTSL